MDTCFTMPISAFAAFVEPHFTVNLQGQNIVLIDAETIAILCAEKKGMNKPFTKFVQFAASSLKLSGKIPVIVHPLASRRLTGKTMLLI